MRCQCSEGNGFLVYIWCHPEHIQCIKGSWHASACLHAHVWRSLWYECLTALPQINSNPVLIGGQFMCKEGPLFMLAESVYWHIDSLPAHRIWFFDWTMSKKSLEQILLLTTLFPMHVQTELSIWLALSLEASILSELLYLHYCCQQSNLNPFSPRQNSRHFEDMFSNAFPSAAVIFWLKCHRSLFLGVQFMKSLLQFRQWFGV